MNLDVNSVECLKEVSQLGKNVYVNICNGQSISVGWGLWEWALLPLVLFMFVLMLWFVIMVWGDIKR